jgi:hypothetical protein
VSGNLIKVYHCESGISLSQASLGRFFYHLLRLGGKVHQVWPFAPHYDRSSVIVSLEIDESKKEQLETLAKIKLRDPPRIVLN